MTVLFIVAAAWLAFANGSNDNFKGVATLWGSGMIGFGAARSLAAAATLLGSLTTAWLGAALVASFTGRGLVDAPTLQAPPFLTSVVIGAATCVLIASRCGLPVSTTHSIVGALAGAALTSPSRLAIERLMGAFVLPLVWVPVVAILLTVVVRRGLSGARERFGIRKDLCVCIGKEVVACIPRGGSAAEMGAALERVRLTVGPQAECRVRYSGRVLGITAERIVALGHVASAVAVSFARGVQDTAKMTGLVVGGAAAGLVPDFGIHAVASGVGLCVALGGTIGVRRVATTLSHRLTPIEMGEGFAANLVTSGLVIGASQAGMPVSTTHCATGSIFGVGVQRHGLDRRIGSHVVAAWIFTLPMAGLAAAAAYAFLT